MPAIKVTFSGRNEKSHAKLKELSKKYSVKLSTLARMLLLPAIDRLAKATPEQAQVINGRLIQQLDVWDEHDPK